MTPTHPDSAAYQERFRARAEERRQRHEADPEHAPKYIPADDPEFRAEAWTAAGPEEEDF